MVSVYQCFCFFSILFSHKDCPWNLSIALLLSRILSSNISLWFWHFIIILPYFSDFSEKWFHSFVFVNGRSLFGTFHFYHYSEPKILYSTSAARKKAPCSAILLAPRKSDSARPTVSGHRKAPAAQWTAGGSLKKRADISVRPAKPFPGRRRSADASCMEAGHGKPFDIPCRIICVVTWIIAGILHDLSL